MLTCFTNPSNKNLCIKYNNSYHKAWQQQILKYQGIDYKHSTKSNKLIIIIITTTTTTTIIIITITNKEITPNDGQTSWQEPEDLPEWSSAPEFWLKEPRSGRPELFLGFDLNEKVENSSSSSSWEVHRWWRWGWWWWWWWWWWWGDFGESEVRLYFFDFV